MLVARQGPSRILRPMQHSASSKPRALHPADSCPQRIGQRQRETSLSVISRSCGKETPCQIGPSINTGGSHCTKCWRQTRVEDRRASRTILVDVHFYQGICAFQQFTSIQIIYGRNEIPKATFDRLHGVGSFQSPTYAKNQNQTFREREHRIINTM